jgi:hypothetical protein
MARESRRTRQLPHQFEVARDRSPDSRVLDLYWHSFTVARHGAMHLSQRCRREWLVLKRTEDVFRRPSHAPSELCPHQRRMHTWRVHLKSRKLQEDLFRHHIRLQAERLAEPSWQALAVLTVPR